jgi:hypothetical protein
VAKNEREILREWTTIVSAIDEGAGLNMAKAVGKKAGKYAPLGLGVGFGAADAAERLSDQDYAGAGIAGLSAAAGMVPGPGTAVAGALDAFNVARDQAKDAGGWKELGKKLQPGVSSAEQMPMEEHDLSEAGLISKLLTKLGKETPNVVKKIDPTGNPLNPQDVGKAAANAATDVGKAADNVATDVGKTRIKLNPGETMDQAIARIKTEKGTANVDDVASKAATDVKSQSTDAAAKDPDAFNWKKAAKTVAGDLYKGTMDTLGSKPVKLVRNTAAGLGAGALGLSMLQNKGETASDTANRLGRKAGGAIADFVAGAAQGTGDAINKREKEAGIDSSSSSMPGNTAFDQAVQDLSKPDGRLGPIKDGGGGLQETRIFTRHPVTGQIVQLNIDNISRVVNQPFYESYECGAGDSAQWQCQVWSSTPVSKLLKGRS